MFRLGGWPAFRSVDPGRTGGAIGGATPDNAARPVSLAVGGLREGSNGAGERKNKGWSPRSGSQIGYATVDLTLATPEENLALDEALLDQAEAGTGSEVLRLWESRQPMVVVGRGSHVAQEVDLAACRRDGVPVLRRTSGGGAIVNGPGCLMYALVLSYALRPRLRAIDVAHRHVLETSVGRCGNFRPMSHAAARAIWRWGS